MTGTEVNNKIVYGALGNYAPDENDQEDICYGLYLKISQYNVFLDIREDKYLEKRKLKAIQLYENSIELQRSLEIFIHANPEFKSRSLSYIGLHSKNLEQGEVFWEPDGYTLLKGLLFISE